MNEREHAIMEAHMANAEDEYFAARPQIDNHDRRAVFQAGFKRAWAAASLPGYPNDVYAAAGGMTQTAIER